MNNREQKSRISEYWKVLIVVAGGILISFAFFWPFTGLWGVRGPDGKRYVRTMWFDGHKFYVAEDETVEHFPGPDGCGCGTHRPTRGSYGMYR